MTRRTIHHRKSETRSATMTGRPSLRKKTRQLPRASQVVGLVPRPKPDPNQLKLPQDRMFVVALSPARAARQQISGELQMYRCFDCGGPLAIDSTKVAKAMFHQNRNGRPIAYIGLDCCLSKYQPPQAGAANK
jgi:hypothetical protein